MGQIVFDLETQRIFEEVAGRNPAELGVSVLGAYFYEGDSYEIFEEGRLGEFEAKLAHCSRVIGFNIRRFDFPVLKPYLKHVNPANLPILDLMEELEKTLGHRVSLQSVANATLGQSKSGSGLDAIRYFRAGEMEKLKSYCLDDVRLTREVYEYGKEHGEVSFLSKDGKNKILVKVNWKDPEPPANYSLF